MEIVEPTITLAKTLDDDRFTIEVLKDLGLTKTAPGKEENEVQSSVPIQSSNMAKAHPRSYFTVWKTINEYCPKIQIGPLVPYRPHEVGTNGS